MNTSDRETCPRCGAPTVGRATGEPCPACLMSGALGSADDDTKTITISRGDLPATPRPTAFPCTFGNYTLHGLLGRGGMGAVYDAEDRATGRRLALKMLSQQLESAEMRQRFLREGRLAARVNHPNSLFVYGSEEVEGVPVITMEVAGGGTLKDELKQRGPLPVAKAVDAILDVIDGLASACAEGVLHRDIKPSNCFVTSAGAVKVGDFGLSVSTLSRTDTFVTAHGMVLGTPAYASPEQLRGDALDLRADTYSVGATLYTLLTNRAPFEGENAVQVVANAVNQEARPVTELRAEVPAELSRAITRCLAKEPSGRYADYRGLREALLPYSSREPEPASLKVRASAAWIDYLIALLPLYVLLMLTVGAEKLIVAPLAERTLYAARYHFLLFGFATLYFCICEGLWGAGLGKLLKGLRVVRDDGSPPGLGRGLVRSLLPILCVEGVRTPLTMAFISGTEWTGLDIALLVIIANVCGWIPMLLMIRARRENGFSTVWDLLSGTRVIIKPKSSERPALEALARSDARSAAADGHDELTAWDACDGKSEDAREEESATSEAAAPASMLGPYEVIEAIVPAAWLAGRDPVLRRRVWLLKRTGGALAQTRRAVARPGRLRWLQEVRDDGATWDAYEAVPGTPFARLVRNGKCIPWAALRHWLHDLAAELWAASSDGSLPAELSLDYVWITAHGQALLLDYPWPTSSNAVPKTTASESTIAVGDLKGQQRFLHAVAAHVDATTVPLHARPVLQNLADGKFEKLSFLAGTLRGLLSQPAEVSRQVRAASIFVLPAYVWTTVLVGYYHDKQWSERPLYAVITSLLVVLGALAVVQLFSVPLRSSVGQAIFRLAIADDRGVPASPPRLLARWAVSWLPLWIPIGLIGSSFEWHDPVALWSAAALLTIWLAVAVHAVAHPHRSWPDRLAGTWVVRR
jgi:uncharacterized RDD family membrane protein YckC